MKKNIIALTIGVVLFFGIVWLGTMLVPNNAGMFFVMALLFVANPLYFIVTGITVGKNPAKSWFVPIVSVAIFAIAYAIVLNMKEWIYSMAYLVLAYATMGITWIARRKQKQKN